ncbi:Endoplasmic reticulum transmembrane protein [Heracleum sosnowskyi]|uniref:Endoplasmic reticulum transmembrane protein n=1 Tax=Heracleum sosnowskyi TaxID=360622 RepID=A0AAD8IPW8_9APIA|nr:Endoplasmic reticulum transmembrane protein [Heracleum sosnowskyi]
MTEVLLAKFIFVEVAILLALSYKTVVRKPIKRALNRVINVEALYILLIVFIIGSLYLAISISSLIIIHIRSIHEASVDDQLIQYLKLLQASLLGILLFLSMLIYKFHHLLRARTSLNKILKVEEKQLKDWKHIIAVQARELESEISKLRAGLEKLEPEYLRKSSEAKAREAVVSDLKKQSEGFNLEYDRELEYNQTLRNQLQSIDQSLLEDKQEPSSWTSLKDSVMRDGLSLLSPWRILEPDNDRSEECSDDNSGCYRASLSGTSVPSSPRHRHRRPIYQH